MQDNSKVYNCLFFLLSCMYLPILLLNHSIYYEVTRGNSLLCVLRHKYGLCKKNFFFNLECRCRRFFPFLLLPSSVLTITAEGRYRVATLESLRRGWVGLRGVTALHISCFSVYKHLQDVFKESSCFTSRRKQSNASVGVNMETLTRPSPL